MTFVCNCKYGIIIEDMAAVMSLIQASEEQTGINTHYVYNTIASHYLSW